MRKQTNYHSREERKKQILKALVMLPMLPKPKKPTMYAIADVIGMRPSSHLTKILLEMEAQGTLKSKTVSNKGKWDTELWYIARKGHAQIAVEARIIPIKTKGQIIGQMEFLSC